MKIGDQFRVKTGDGYLSFWWGAVVELVKRDGNEVVLRVVSIKPNNYRWHAGKTFAADVYFLNRKCEPCFREPSLFRRDRASA